MSENNKNEESRRFSISDLMKATAQVAIAVAIAIGVYQFSDWVARPVNVVVSNPPWGDPADDFRRQWEVTENCPQPLADLTMLHHKTVFADGDPPASVEIIRRANGSFGLSVSSEFALDSTENIDGWNSAILEYCPDSSKACNAEKRYKGEFDCDATYLDPDSDYLWGTAEIHGETHNIEIYLIEEDDGSVSPVVGYEHGDGGSHRGVIH